MVQKFESSPIFTMRFSHYEEVPKMVQDKLVAEAQKHRQEEHE
jgi:translation elongation factor EF-G